jgi:tRNA threonylcarbamoyladenosine biosynthesis protein TsaE
MKIIIKDKSHLHNAAVRFLADTRGKKIFAFYGSMGAGKTTIIKAICETLGARNIVTSPTFTLVNEYKTKQGESLFHIDFYRIRKTEEVFDFGIEEYFSSGSYCFMEWPELIEEYLPSETVKVRITVDEDAQRILDIE